MQAVVLSECWCLLKSSSIKEKNKTNKTMQEQKQEGKFKQIWHSPAIWLCQGCLTFSIINLLLEFWKHNVEQQVKLTPSEQSFICKQGVYSSDSWKTNIFTTITTLFQKYTWHTIVKMFFDNIWYSLVSELMLTALKTLNTIVIYRLLFWVNITRNYSTVRIERKLQMKKIGRGKGNLKKIID